MEAKWVASTPKEIRVSRRRQAPQTKATMPHLCLKSSRVQCAKIVSSKNSNCSPILITVIAIMPKFYDQLWGAKRVRTLLFKLCRTSQRIARYSRIMQLTIKICSSSKCNCSSNYQVVKSSLVKLIILRMRSLQCIDEMVVDQN